MVSVSETQTDKYDRITFLKSFEASFDAWQ